MSASIFQSIKGTVVKKAGTLMQSAFNNELVASISVQTEFGIEKIWGNAGSPIFSYAQNAPIEYVKNGKNYQFINAPQTPVSSQPNAASDNVSTVKAETKAEKGAKMLEDIEISTRLYAKIFQETQDRMLPFALKDELLVSIATTQYINIARKYI